MARGRLAPAPWLGAMVVLVLTGCNTALWPTPVPAPLERPPRVPIPDEFEIGKAYPFDLMTHCGLDMAYVEINGQLFLPTADSGPWAPPGWGNPTDRGRLMLDAPDLALFESSTGEIIELRPVDPPASPLGCI
jgi:hypothetical protein